MCAGTRAIVCLSTKRAKIMKFNAKAKKLIEQIAKKYLNIETLKVRNSDGLDFHDVYVGSMKDALEEAYQAGMKAGSSNI